MTITDFCWIIYLLCRVYGLSVTSWGRTEKRNAEVGGVPNSWHLRFLGVDVVPDDPIVFEPLQHLADQLGLELIAEGDHWHIEPKGSQSVVV